MDCREERRRTFLVRTMGINKVMREHQAKEKARLGESDDSKLRREIHEYIKTLRGATKEKALQALYERFEGEKYKKYYQYFETWVECELMDREER